MNLPHFTTVSFEIKPFHESHYRHISRMFGSVIHSVCLLIFAFLPGFYAPEGPFYPILDQHICDGNAFIAGGDKFHYSGRRRNDIKPSRTYLYQQFPYVWLKQMAIGQTLFLRGKVNSNADIIQVALMGGDPVNKGDSGATVLEIKFMFSAGQIGFNTKRNGKWLDEKRIANPLRRGGTFDLSIHAKEDLFEIRVNKKKVYEYYYILGLDYINYIIAQYDMELDIAYQSGQIFPIPYLITFPHWDWKEIGELRLNEAIFLVGESAYLPFTITIYDEKDWNKNLVKFQMTVDFDERTVSRRAQWPNGTWTEVENGGGFPFETGSEFDMSIKNTAAGLILVVDGKLFVMFIHRTEKPGEDYRFIEFSGAMEMRILNICGP
uniref:Galectin n=1 Tax=Panagrellus redivivus TaxID=6233 RepID=A0A7E4VDS6_PANRE